MSNDFTLGEDWPPLPENALKDSTPQFLDHPMRHNTISAYVEFLATKIAGMLPPGGTRDQALSKINDQPGATFWRTLKPVKPGGTPGMVMTRIGTNGYDWREPESAKPELDKQGVTQWWHIDVVPPTYPNTGIGRVGDVWVVVKEVAQ